MRFSTVTFYANWIILSMMKNLIFTVLICFCCLQVWSQDSSAVITVRKPVEYDLFTSFGNLKGNCKTTIEELRRFYKIKVWNKGSDASFYIKSFRITGVDYGTRYEYYIIGDEMSPEFHEKFKEVSFKKVEIHDIIVTLADGSEALAKGISIQISAANQ
jgi:hypothetical protein